MWDDPLFNPVGAAEFLSLGTTDPAWLAQKRREMTLDTLNLLFAKLNQLETALARSQKSRQEFSARGVWVWEQLIDHVPPEVRERVTIEFEVNRMDPDFSWVKAISQK